MNRLEFVVQALAGWGAAGNVKAELQATVSSWEALLLLALVTVLLGGWLLLRATRRGAPAAPDLSTTHASLVLWAAQGFGAGRIPFAPGTWGSLVGLLWTAVLLRSGDLWVFAVGLLAGLALSVWVCGQAETILREKDPGSVVLDEIAAMPLCFLWVGLKDWVQCGRLPDPERLVESHTWLAVVGVFVLFRAFDIWKPWPVRQSQRLPGGWGVTADDVLAALWTALVTAIVLK
jgi:phosphatidylglycerophosphatase A